MKFKNMQKLQLELKNVPRDVFQVPCSTNPGLNRDQSLSAQDKVLDCNNLDGNQPQQTEEPKAKVFVFVLSIEGLPLMPCKPAKARKLLKSEKAKVIKRCPFTIQLNFECENQVQECKLGIDSGYRNIGFSVISEKTEFISGTLILDDKTSKRLQEKSMYRRNRRSRHHWYRKCRFLNRKRCEGWLPPSIQRRYDTHLNLIKKLKSLIPITQVIVEVANFDIQKLENPEISGVEYQQGDLYDYQNLRSYLMSREYGKCQFCGKEFTKDDSSHIHHIIPRSQGGTNRPKNLALLHKSCHKKLHKEGLHDKLKKNKQFKESTFMSIIHKRFWKDIEDLQVTYGYRTWVDRNKLGLIKSHINDAFVIVGGSKEERCKEFKIEQKHRHSRVLQLNRKGFKPSIRKKRHEIQCGDLVFHESKWKKARGTHCYGTRVYIENELKTILTKNIEKVFHFGSFCWI